MRHRFLHNVKKQLGYKLALFVSASQLQVTTFQPMALPTINAKHMLR